ncbi:hypothetical protein [Actinokineospora sp. HUAS TT18]|uniref:hypothetical protein n=1 Tax=Actinokineospora sp. HUAS TT18 TaxID=3447451 RepID=UPI003F527F07
MRDIAESLLGSTSVAVDEVPAAAHREAAYRVLLDDPQLAAADCHMSKAYFRHWLSATLQNPGARVGPCVDPEVQQFARDLVRRGLDMQRHATSTDARECVPHFGTARG